jgi:hypothetical protein
MNLIKNLKCFMGIHDYFFIRELHFNSHLSGCKYCKKLYVMNNSFNSLIKYDADMEIMHNNLSQSELEIIIGSLQVIQDHLQDAGVLEANDLYSVIKRLKKVRDQSFTNLKWEVD